MPLNTIPLPFGLRDVKLTPYTDATATVLGTPSVDLPNGRTLGFEEEEAFEDLRGDDRLVASHGSGPQVNWTLEGGGISFEAGQVMYGGTISTTGSTPNQVKTWRKLVTDVRPYFRIQGQAISDSGGDVWAVIYRAKATDNLTGEFGDGQFFLTGASGTGYASLVASELDRVWDFVQHETAVAIP